MADAKEEKTEEAPEAGPKKILGLPLPVFIFAAVNLLVMAGAFAFIAYASLVHKKPAITEVLAQSEITKVEKKKAAAAEQEFIPISYPEMTITLRSEQGGKTHYATVEATLVCGSEECEAQVKENKAKVEDSIQTVLSARSYLELSSLDTKFRMKHEILGRVNSYLKETAVIDLLFTGFLVQ
jgi:flagellar FliL protein